MWPSEHQPHTWMWSLTDIQLEDDNIGLFCVSSLFTIIFALFTLS